MGRPSRIDEQRKTLLPVIARAFAELGYRRATTAELAHRCGIRENILYRLWDDKRSMFLAAIEFLHDKRMQIWTELAATTRPPQTVAERLIDYEIRHLGEGGFHRIVFAALAETEEEEVQSALRRMYADYQQFLTTHIAEYRQSSIANRVPDEGDTAWAVIGLVTILNILNELQMQGRRKRIKTFAAVSRFLLGVE
jgi:AcrR family transcriptional regulator